MKDKNNKVMDRITNARDLDHAYKELDRLWDEYDGTCLNPQILQLEKRIEDYNPCDILESDIDEGVLTSQ
jgi:hypothetical protein